MLRGYWRYIAPAFGCLIVALVIGWLLQPEQPDLASDDSYQEQSPKYRAGGTNCDPRWLNRLAGAERISKTDACEEAKEQHRQATNQLIEARRSADAANAQAVLAYKQTGIAGWGMGLGFVTMLAAIGAAFYAREAAKHSKTSAEAFVDAERAILRIRGGDECNIDGNVKQRAIAFTFRNIGRSTARITKIYALKDKTPVAMSSRWTDIAPDGEVNVVAASVPEDINRIIDQFFVVEYNTLSLKGRKSTFRAIIKHFDGAGLTWDRWMVEVFDQDGHPDDT